MYGFSVHWRFPVVPRLGSPLRLILPKPNYNSIVARGWESKSIEAQQAEAGEKSRTPGKKMSPAEAAAVREKEGLRLARQRVLQQIEASANPRHRALLEEALAALNAKLSQ